jgi:hypothetical protein
VAAACGHIHRIGSTLQAEAIAGHENLIANGVQPGAIRDGYYYFEECNYISGV